MHNLRAWLEREQLKKTTKVYNLTRLYSYDSAISSFACDVWEQGEKNMMDKNGKIIGYYVTGTKLFAEDFEDGEDIDIVPKNFKQRKSFLSTFIPVFQEFYTYI